MRQNPVFLRQLCLFWFCSLWLDATAGSAIQYDESQKEHIESFFIFFSSTLPCSSLTPHPPPVFSTLLLLLFLLLSRIYCHSLTFTFSVYSVWECVCVQVKCSSFPISVMHVDKVGSERWRKDMFLHASLSLSVCFPYMFCSCLIIGYRVTQLLTIILLWVYSC